MNKTKSTPPNTRLKDLDPKADEAGDIATWLHESFNRRTSTSGPSIPSLNASVVLHDIISQLMEVYPAITRQNPDGSVWDGIALPDSVLAFTRDQDCGNLDLARGNLLDIACEHGSTDDGLKILVASGFDPTHFSRKVGMTPIGKCAFDGNASALRLFAQAGFDLSLPMSAEHTRDPALVGSNLLHRLMNMRDLDSPQGLEVVDVLLVAGVDPLAVNQDGQTPFELARGNIRVAMEKWLAANQATALEGAVEHPKEPLIAPGPRF